MGKFTIRQYLDGDGEEINALYREVTGRQRSQEEYQWQWLLSPSGLGDIWLIIDEERGGKIIGHHGVMPIRFTRGDTDLLFGKIENTMVLPAYRGRVLYPRYEVRFQREYIKRYDALFATMGPSEAIRTRLATGYQFPVEWRTLYIATGSAFSFDSVAFLRSKAWGYRSSIPSEPGGNDELELGLLKSGFLSSEAARSSSFLNQFWSNARHSFSVAPRRDAEDLQWRFWQNPYKRHYAFVFKERGAEGFAIVSVTSRGVWLEDIAVSPNETEAYQVFLGVFLDAMRSSGVSYFGFQSTSDAANVPMLQAMDQHELLAIKLLRPLRKRTPARMPRLVTERGGSRDVQLHDWTLTPIVTEGR
ncbi:GNAT family N-acetyltransferase [Congregibacter brevis]|uniref:GNAT family N-acetyltransferase n=1 Tax=Congregibacter brevis TaxID=3081201 RepID=A0ABZ0IBM9_9GAMM|nr:GNAT family N-acetyltransferase [Congregibacter sp. IMCC45268]